MTDFRTRRRLQRTWQSVAAPARAGMASPLHYQHPLILSFQSLPAPPPSHGLRVRVKPFRQHMYLYAFPLRTAGVVRKSFDSFFLEVTPCRISLGSRWWSLASPSATVPWTYLTRASSLCEVSSRAASARLPPVSLTEPGHHENWEAAEELCVSDLRSPIVVPVHGSRKCWQHCLQHTGR